MPNYNLSTRGRVADIGLGLRVDVGATAIAGAGTTKDLYTIVGGNVAVTAILGEVTTIIQNQADNTKFISTPTTGTAVDICSVADIANLEVGGLISIDGTAADALVIANAGSVPLQAIPVVLAPGVLGINTAANNTGAFKFSLWYVPLEDGAYVEAA